MRFRAATKSRKAPLKSKIKMPHELIKRDYIYRGRILDLSLSRYGMADGGEAEIEVIHHNGGAGALPIFDDGTIALVKQWRYPLERFSLEIPAGRIEQGHTPEQTALREVEEELGYRAGNLRKLAEFNVAPGYCRERLFVFLATELEPTAQKLDDDEEIEVVRMSFSHALALVHSGEIDDAKSIITILLASNIEGVKK